MCVCYRPGRPTFQYHVTCVCMSQARTTYISMSYHMCVCNRPGRPTFKCHVTCVYVTGQDDLHSNGMSHVCMSKARRTYISMSCHVCMSQARTTYIAMSYIAVCVFNFLSLSFVDVGGIDDNHCLNFLFISLSYMYQQHP